MPATVYDGTDVLMSLCRVRIMIMATMPVRKNTMSLCASCGVVVGGRQSAAEGIT